MIRPFNTFTIWWLALIVKLVLSWAIPLTPDEAYYWVWSHHLQWSYFDHPPMVAWWFWLGHPFENFGSAVRWPAVLIGHMAALVWLRILRRTLDPDTERTWLLLFLITPLTGPGSLIVTPDLPQMLFWPWAIYALLTWRKLPSRWQALYLGLILGLGFLSKYTMALFVPIALLWLFADRVRWSTIARALPLAAIGFVLGSLPVWIWNWANQFASLAFQLHHGLGRPTWKPSWTYEYVAAQIGLLTPVVVYFALRSRASLWLKYFSWVPLSFFLVTSLRGYVEANWPIMALPGVLALSVGTKSRRWLNGVIVFWSIGLIAILIQLVFAWPLFTGIKTKLDELRRFDRLVAAAQDFQPLFARSYQVAAKLSFELKRPVNKLAGMNRRDFYDFLASSQPSTNRFYLVIYTDDTLPDQWLSRGYTMGRKFKVDDQFTIVEIEAK